MTKPCTYCPVWEWLNDPATREGERAIRADEARRHRRSLERAQERINQLEDQLRRGRAGSQLRSAA